MGAPAGPTPPSSGPAFCPNCHAPVPLGMRFCGQCGAPMPATAAPATAAPATPPPATPPPVDIRQKVDEDRGFLKRLQLMLPGFRGYRQGEDIRAADSLLRIQIANKLVDALSQLQRIRQSLVQANQYGSLNDLALVISDLTTLEGKVRHAEQGYSGISPNLRIQPQDLDRLYEYDYGFVMAADQFRGQLPRLGMAATGNDAAGISSAVADLRGLLTQLTNAFVARMTTIEGIAV